MDSTLLVDQDIEDGRKLIKALDRSKFALTGALWFYFSDARDWLLLLVSPLADTSGPTWCYRKIQSVIEDMPRNFGLSLSRISVVSPTDSLIRLLGKAIHVEGTSRVRFRRNTINGVFIEDALIYRLRRTVKT